MVFNRVPRMAVTLGQQYNVGEKPAVILYTYINYHAQPPIITQHNLFGGTLMVGLITEPLGFVQDTQDLMVLFGEWLAVLELCSVRVLDEPSVGRDACMS